MLGYAYTKDQRIPVPGAAKNGPPVTIRTDYSVRIGTRTVVIQFGDLPSQFQVKLNEEGMGLVQIAGDDDRKTALEKVLKGLDIPYVEEDAEFSPPGDERPPRWILTLAVIRLTSEKGTIYLVPPMRTGSSAHSSASAGTASLSDIEWDSRRDPFRCSSRSEQEIPEPVTEDLAEMSCPCESGHPEVLPGCPLSRD